MSPLPDARSVSAPGTRSAPAIPRSLQLALFLTGLLWAVVARVAAVRSARGVAQALHIFEWQPLLRESFFLFLLLAGFSTLSWIATRTGGVRAVNALPERPTAGREWAAGAALGWTLLLVAVTPAIVFGRLRPEFSWTPHDIYALILSVLAVFVLSFGIEVAFRGFLYRLLIGALGAGAATVVISGIFALAASFGSFGAPASARSVQVIFCAGLLYAAAYLRTHAVWFGAGLRFGWSATAAILFGLPLSGSTEYGSVVFSVGVGSHFITGGAYGPDGATWSAFVLLAGIAALYWLTRDYAWSYTHPPIVAGGYPMDVPPPAAHTAMEAASAPPALVQILPVTPNTPSTLPAAASEVHRPAAGDS